jgi:DNA polymerase III alpha subunit
MGACRKVYNIAKKNNLTPILGLEAYFRPEGQCPILAKHGITGAELEHYYNEIYKYGHITMHAMDQVAYEALVKTLSKAHLNRAERHGSEVKPLFNWEDLEFLGQYNITMTSGCLVGIISRHLLKEERYDIALDYYERLRTIPKPGNFIVEVFPHKCTHKWENGVFVHFADGTKQKFYAKKKLRTENGELTAEELYRRSKTNKQLTGIKNRHKWDEFDPKEIAKVEFIEDFIQNECTSYAPDGDLQLPANKFLIALAERYGDSIIISDDSHFSHPEAYLIQTAKLRGAGGGGWPFHNSYHRMSSEEVAPHFLQYMGIPKAKFENWIDNGLNWASKFKDFKFSDSKQLPTSFYPKDSLGYLKTLIDKHGRMDWNDPVRVARLKQEIGWLHNNGTIDLLPYFFPPEEVMDLYNQKEVLSGPGRGSSAALLINYLLEITHVDPIEHDLPLERFITPDRIKSGKLPDVDMDFSDRSFIDDQENGWLKTRFGENAAKISTSVLMRVKSSIKDVARYKHGAVSEEIENLCKKMPNPIQGVSDWDQVFGYVGDDGKEVKGFIDTSPALQEYVAKYPDDWEIVKKMLGLSRTRSQHACAVVLADKKISDFIPLMKIGDSTCTQYTAESVEEAGGVKLDFLTISSLKDIGDTIKLVQSRYLEEPLDKTVYIDGVPTPRHRILPFENKLCDIWKLPEEQKVFNKVALGDTETVFQFNTASAKKWLKYFAHTDASGNPIIRSVHDMALFTALDRPGPLDALNSAGKNMLVEYSNRARGQPYTDSMEVLEELLPETLGVIAYQESLQKVYQNLTGCTGSEAEEFRSNAAKKKADKVLAAYPFFIERASEKIGREQAEQLWVQLQTFLNTASAKPMRKATRRLDTPVRS